MIPVISGSRLPARYGCATGQSGFVGLGIDTFFARRPGSPIFRKRGRVYFDVIDRRADTSRRSGSHSYLKQQSLSGREGWRRRLLPGRAICTLDCSAIKGRRGHSSLLWSRRTPKGEPDVRAAQPLKMLNHDMSPIDYVEWIKVRSGTYAAKMKPFPVRCRRLESELRATKYAGRTLSSTTRPRTFIAFTNPSTNPKFARQSWERTIQFSSNI